MTNNVIGDEQRETYSREGYLILRNAFDPSRIRSLVEAVNWLIDRALAGQVTIPWIGQPSQRTPERLSNLLDPGRYHPAYAAWLEEDLIPLVESLLKSPVRHSLFGMLAGGGGKPYLQAWHHDLPNPSNPSDPAVIVNPEPFWFTQFNAPLQPHDQFLQIVPGSHNRPASTAEKEAFQRDCKGDMPGQLTVAMEPGDIAFYNANLWHRGYNPKGQLRWTMHTAMWRCDFPVMTHEAGQRESLLSAGHLDQMPPRTRAALQAYLDAYPAGEPPGPAELLRQRSTAHH